MNSWTLLEHVALFLPAALVISLVYNSLRRESLAEIIHIGLRRFAFFVGIAAVSGAVVLQLTRWL